MNNTLAPLAACVPSADLSVTRVYLLSVRTRAGCSVSKSYNQVGACNQRKEVCNSNYVSSRSDTALLGMHVHGTSADRANVIKQGYTNGTLCLVGNTPQPPKSHIFSANQI